MWLISYNWNCKRNVKLLETAVAFNF